MTSAFVGEGVERVRAAAPLVHNVTNQVAMTLSANVLIAVGASPIMAQAPEEAGDLAAIVGRPGRQHGHPHPRMDRRRACPRSRVPALPAGPGSSIPVGVGASAFRRDTAADLLDRRPRIVRGNASEILALAGGGGGGKGVDSTHGADAAAEAATALAARLGAVVAVTGAVDLVTDGRRTLRVANGHRAPHPHHRLGLRAHGPGRRLGRRPRRPARGHGRGPRRLRHRRRARGRGPRAAAASCAALLDALGDLDGDHRPRMARLA